MKKKFVAQTAARENVNISPLNNNESCLLSNIGFKFFFFQTYSGFIIVIDERLKNHHE